MVYNLGFLMVLLYSDFNPSQEIVPILFWSFPLFWYLAGAYALIFGLIYYLQPVV
jgi:hypothetical protein